MLAVVERVFVYSTPVCAFCYRAKSLLKQKGIPFSEVDVSTDAALHAWMREASGRRTVPEIFIDGAPIGGFDELARLDRSGKLDLQLSSPKPAQLVAPHEGKLRLQS